MNERLRTLSMLLLAAVSGVLAGSCIPEFTSGLPGGDKPMPDDRVTGIWKDENSRLLIFPRKSGLVDMVLMNELGEEKGATVLSFVGYMAKVGNESFFCFKQRADDKEEQGAERGYTIAHYSLSKDGALSVSLFNLEAVKKLIDDGKLKGTVETKQGQPFKTVIVTASSEELAAAIAQEGVKSFVSGDPGDVMPFTRVEKVEPNR